MVCQETVKGTGARIWTAGEQLRALTQSARWSEKNVNHGEVFGGSGSKYVSRLSFFLSGRSDFFEEIAKYRAVRRIWYRIMKEQCTAKNLRSTAFRFHVQTAGAVLTAQQPLNNIARTAYHGLSAVLGGAQSIHIDGYDKALCTPTELSAFTALRTNQILQLETRVPHTIEPLGGSHFVGSLTNRMEERIVDLLEKINRKGGIVKTAESPDDIQIFKWGSNLDYISIAI